MPAAEGFRTWVRCPPPPPIQDPGNGSKTGGLASTSGPSPRSSSSSHPATHATDSGSRALIPWAMRRSSGCARRSVCAIRRQALLASGGALPRPQPLARLDLCRPDRVQLPVNDRDLGMELPVVRRVVTAAGEPRRDCLQLQALVPPTTAELRPRDHRPPERKCFVR